jgi:hypothetical protein
MNARTALTILLLLLTISWAAAQRTTQPSGAPGASAQATSPEQARASQADVQKMRVLVQQMQMNLVSLPPGPTPLRHQFELEIEAWQTLIAHMERQHPDAGNVVH